MECYNRADFTHLAPLLRRCARFGRRDMLTFAYQLTSRKTDPNLSDVSRPKIRMLSPNYKDCDETVHLRPGAAADCALPQHSPTDKAAKALYEKG